MRALDFLDGRRYIVHANVCRGCFMNEREVDLPAVLQPVYDDGELTVRQDAEWPVPGFMVVAVRPHLATIADLPLKLALKTVTVVRAVRAVMRDDLGLAAVHIYQEDKFVRPHFHAWMLPLWPAMLREHDINPRIYESNIVEYLRLFSFPAAESEINRCATAIREGLDARLTAPD
jgi:diadenosine tetraphosphate (Ap4A) HIT family hydrolase